tara:strand:+ start:274 stop:693 length:420 start_codon:yes stop_codon:yes gene_type:complete
MKIHHLGLVSNNIEGLIKSLNINKSSISETINDPVQNNKLQFIYLSENKLWLELIEPSNEKSTTYKFVKKNGQGLHHIGVTCDSIEQVENSYSNLEDALVVGRYDINVKSFGGNIKTLFMVIKGLIIEFVKINNTSPNK